MALFRTYDANGKPHSRWRFTYRDHAGRRCKATGTTSRTETVKLAAKVQADHDAIRKGWRDAPKQSATMAFAEALAQYIAWGKDTGGRRGFGWAKSVQDEKKRILNWWAGRLGIEIVKDFEGSLRAVENAVAELNQGTKDAPGICAKTTNHYVGDLKAFLSWLEDRGLIAENPLRGMRKKADAPTQPHRLLTPEELKSLLAVASANRNLVYRVALATGYRQGEIRALTVSSLDPFGPALKLDAKHTKNRKPARQFISQELFQELKAAAAGRPTDAPLLDMPQKETASENFSRDLEKAGIAKTTDDGKATFHSLRVCFIQAVVDGGADLKTILEAARHCAASMSLDVYAKPNLGRIKAAALEAADAVLREIVPIEAQRKVAVAGSDCEAMEYMASPPGFEPGS